MRDPFEHGVCEHGRFRDGNSVVDRVSMREWHGPPKPDLER
jgi:hypothetical protein